MAKRTRRLEGLDWLPFEALPSALLGLRPHDADVVVWHLGIGVPLAEIAANTSRSTSELRRVVEKATAVIRGTDQSQPHPLEQRALRNLANFATENGKTWHPPTRLISGIAQSWERAARDRRLRSDDADELKYSMDIYAARPPEPRYLRSAGRLPRMSSTRFEWCERAARLGNMDAFMIITRMIED